MPNNSPLEPLWGPPETGARVPPYGPGPARLHPSIDPQGTFAPLSPCLDIVAVCFHRRFGLDIE